MEIGAIDLAYRDPRSLIAVSGRSRVDDFGKDIHTEGQSPLSNHQDAFGMVKQIDNLTESVFVIVSNEDFDWIKKSSYICCDVVKEVI